MTGTGGWILRLGEVGGDLLQSLVDKTEILSLWQLLNLSSSCHWSIHRYNAPIPNEVSWRCVLLSTMALRVAMIPPRLMDTSRLNPS